MNLRVPAFIEISREHFELVLWKPRLGEFVEKARYPIAIGQLGHETPAGVFRVHHKSRTPDWEAPNSEWVPLDMRGKTFHFDDPRNPFAGGFIAFNKAAKGVGIHGTKFDPKLGTMASHGCIRMGAEGIKDLYHRVPVGSLVCIY